MPAHRTRPPPAFRYRPLLFDTLRRKCREETKVGKVANASLLILYQLVTALKALRAAWQSRGRRPMSSRMPQLPALNEAQRSALALLPPRHAVVARLSSPSQTVVAEAWRRRFEAAGERVDIFDELDVERLLDASPFLRGVVFLVPSSGIDPRSLAELRRRHGTRIERDSFALALANQEAESDDSKLDFTPAWLAISSEAEISATPTCVRETSYRISTRAALADRICVVLPADPAARAGVMSALADVARTHPTITVCAIDPDAVSDESTAANVRVAALAPFVALLGSPERVGVVFLPIGHLLPNVARLDDLLESRGLEPLRYRVEGGLLADPDTFRRIADERISHAAERGSRSLDPLPAIPRSPSQRSVQACLVNVHFAPTSFGGATIVAERMFERLTREHGFSFSVFTGTFDPALSDYQSTIYFHHEAPVHAVRYPREHTWEEIWRNPRIAALFRRHLETFRPEVVHLHCVQHLGGDLLSVCEDLGIPSVVTLHDSWWICARQFRFVEETGTRCPKRACGPLGCGQCWNVGGEFAARSAHLEPLLAKATALLAPSRFQAQLYLANGFDPKRLHVNENGVVPPGQGYRHRITRRDDTIRFAFVGGPSKVKGFSLVEAVFGNPLPSANWELVLPDPEAKKGGNSRFPRNLVSHPRVRLCEPYKNETMDAFFEDVDVLLAPSQVDESFGLAVREALVRDVWVICSDNGGLPEAILPGRNGRVVPGDNLEAFRAAIVECLERPGGFKDFSSPEKERVRTVEDQGRELAAILKTIAVPR